ncbi:MAG: XdhC family protein [Planctomycetes bacterium]|nr:XdhC family protein [Planctomycetota bacterium]
MPQDFHSLAQSLSDADRPFCTATVVRSEGSASAPAGAKAILSDTGELLFGYVGGGCVQAQVASEAVDALQDGRPRMVPLELSDELGATGVPCGGRMEVFVEPHIPRPRLLVLGHGRLVEALCDLGARVGYRVIVDDPDGTRELYPAAESVVTDDPDYERLAATPRTWVVVATHHKSDHLAISRALDLGAAGISMVASTKRREAVFSVCREMKIAEEKLAGIRAPAGLDLGGKTPEEIALSVISEIVALRCGGSGRPMREVKKEAGASRGSCAGGR